MPWDHVASLIIALTALALVSTLVNLALSVYRLRSPVDPNAQANTRRPGTAVVTGIALIAFLVFGWFAADLFSVRDTGTYNAIATTLTPRCESGMEIEPGGECLHPVLGKFSVNENGQGVLEGSPHGPSDNPIKVDWEIHERTYGFQARPIYSLATLVDRWEIVLAGLWKRLGVCDARMDDRMIVEAGQSCIWQGSEFRVYAVDQRYPWDDRDFHKNGYGVLFRNWSDDGPEAQIDNQKVVFPPEDSKCSALFVAERLNGDNEHQWEIKEAESTQSTCLGTDVADAASNTVEEAIATARAAIVTAERVIAAAEAATATAQVAEEAAEMALAAIQSVELAASMVEASANSASAAANAAVATNHTIESDLTSIKTAISKILTRLDSPPPDSSAGTDPAAAVDQDVGGRQPVHPSCEIVELGEVSGIIELSGSWTSSDCRGDDFLAEYEDTYVFYLGTYTSLSAILQAQFEPAYLLWGVYHHDFGSVVWSESSDGTLSYNSYESEAPFLVPGWYTLWVASDAIGDYQLYLSFSKDDSMQE